MTKEALAKAIQREPFQPFTLHLADGRDVRVPHREFLSMHPTGRTVVVYGQDEDLDILDVMLVTGIRIGARNGHRKQ
jgi:hypothetical protein